MALARDDGFALAPDDGTALARDDRIAPARDHQPQNTACPVIALGSQVEKWGT